MTKRVNEPRETREQTATESKKKMVLLRNGNPQGNPNNAPRCGAKTRKGTPCRGPAMANGRCRLHGGKSTGPRTPEGLERSRKANWKHGRYSAESLKGRRDLRDLLRESKALLKWISESTGSEWR